MEGPAVVVVSRRGGAIPEVVVLLPAIPAVVLKLLLLLALPTTPGVEPKAGSAAGGPPPVAVDVLVLRVLRLEEERCRLRDGVGWLDDGPKRPLVDRVFAEFAGSALPSVTLVDVEDVLETAEAVCCLRRVSSRVSRLTMASCSFSICMCRSAAVRGRGCRSGPGPGSVPVSSCRTGG